MGGFAWVSCLKIREDRKKKKGLTLCLVMNIHHKIVESLAFSPPPSGTRPGMGVLCQARHPFSFPLRDWQLADKKPHSDDACWGRVKWGANGDGVSRDSGESIVQIQLWWETLGEGGWPLGYQDTGRVHEACGQSSNMRWSREWVDYMVTKKRRYTSAKA